ncbi:phosphoribosylaminoimidazolecarboxamide formyltransferase / IMP cyclohydrolase [Litoreibacter ascidiaceicola]|uniref:Bifunctional purine biosynthesis protein PurH n=1 Tax=Litoreibacter ascidiaceicola TaxID=1486859 RepID=A0A1M5D4B7_9RHOB|nr:bifunctional phosphoribosylaminoimidazolecarboxamide formyltransferase/IMP cyclohydrolase [Litoreibacter ascidiaceicola]SHF61923.1 phosphoribosylaminoimidazolecarboxamide formyltransferase / IMP cyclohydrolase [Litoreibacter ascidiaceicola]
MTDLVPVRRALLSVSDKSGLIDFARALAGHGVELLSTGGTAAAIRDAGLDVKDVSEVTGFPEMMDGRVKTLHPIVHGGLLALRDNEGHVGSMTEHGIGAIDLLVVNLYPFEETVAKGADYATCIENIDIGGPAMLRSAAKNHQFVNVVTDVQDYEAVLAEMMAQDGATSYAFRQRLALTAYSRTAAYDTAVSGWMAGALGETPRRKSFAGTLAQTLRYGENPHQQAAFYTDGSARPGVATAQQHQGKELSYNNINDTDAAFELVAEFDPKDGPAVAIIKHANPCGVARGATVAEAYNKAFECDQTSAFGGIIAVNQPLDGATAEAISGIFTEVVIAPGADDDARAIFAKKKNLRLLTTDGLPDPVAAALTVRQVSGGLLVQDKDNGRILAGDLKVVTKRAPSEQELADMLFAWRVAKHVKSNAIVYVKDGATVGIGAGQMSRVDSSRIAARKAQDVAELLKLPEPRTIGSAVASDAFFPFADGLQTAAEAGATALIQPGGSMRDDEVIAAADELGLAMVFTGMRHFRH